MSLKKLILAAVVPGMLCVLPTIAFAALSFTIDPNGWPNAPHRQAAVNALQSAVNRYNAYGDFGNYNVWAYYNAGIPTAQANYLGSIGYGGTYPNERVTMHEMSHYLGTGTYGTPWDGPRAEAIVDQFDGLEASLNGDSAHYWPYGLNYDSEGSEIGKQRHVALLYAMRADMGIGSSGNPSSWAATSIALNSSDPEGTSGFNHASNWSDNTFAHPNADYSTGALSMRTPEGFNSWRFAGKSLTVNSNGRLLYNGWGTTGVVTINNLILDGGTVRHDQFSQDLFQLAGKVTLASNSTIDAGQGDIRVLSQIGGTGSLTKIGSNTLTLTSAANYSGNTVISGGTLRLATVTPIGSYTFDLVSGNSVVNRGSGGAAMNGTLAGGATIVAGGQTGNAVSLAGGASVDINNPITDLGNNSNWTVSAWVKTSTPGSSLLAKGSGSGWANGNTIFYLGDGAAGGSGDIPSAVRFAGGFFQGSIAATPVADNTWHQVTYVNNAGSYAIYVDGVAQPLSPGNAGFGNADIGSIVRLGISTNTFAGDGTVNFNGLMDSVQFFGQALSAQQISSLYEGGRQFGSLPSSSSVTIANGATLDLNGAIQPIGSLTGPAGSVVTLGSGRLVVNSAANTQFGGVISGTGSLIKEGPGALTLAGANTYSGATTVAGGKLLVDGSLSGNTIVQNGATLGGAGAINGAVTVQSGGALTPGNNTGSFDVDSLTLSAGSLLDIEIGSVSDLIHVNGGNVFLDGTLRVSLLDGYWPAGGDSFSILDGSWAALSGAFQELQLPSLSSGLMWNTSQLFTTGVLSVSSTANPGDFNEDGVVSGLDLASWQVGFTAGGPATHTQGDADGDADVDGADFLIWQRSVGAVVPLSPLAAVPEPQPILLVTLALSFVVAKRTTLRGFDLVLFTSK